MGRAAPSLCTPEECAGRGRGPPPSVTASNSAAPAPWNAWNAGQGHPGSGAAGSREGVRGCRLGSRRRVCSAFRGGGSPAGSSAGEWRRKSEPGVCLLERACQAALGGSPGASCICISSAVEERRVLAWRFHCSRGRFTTALNCKFGEETVTNSPRPLLYIKVLDQGQVPNVIKYATTYLFDCTCLTAPILQGEPLVCWIGILDSAPVSFLPKNGDFFKRMVGVFWF